MVLLTVSLDIIASRILITVPEIKIKIIANNVFVNPIDAISKKSGANKVKPRVMASIAENNMPVNTVIGWQSFKSIAMPVNVKTIVAIELIKTVSSSEPWVN